MRKTTRRWLLGTASVGTMLLIVAALPLAYFVWKDRRPNFHDSFARNGQGELRQDGWKSFGGTWQVVDGAMLNISDDRGAKLINGSAKWKNYIVEADIQLLGEAGDAGFVVRTSQEEVGVDAYHGYFAGLRDIDDTLIMGRADYGWHEFQSTPVRYGIRTRTWYHLKVLAYGCTLLASSTTEKGVVTTALIEEPKCLASGRFGLQSYSTGAAWRNVVVRPAAKSDLDAMLQARSLSERERTKSASSAPGSWMDERFFEPIQRELREHKSDLNAKTIADLRLLAPTLSSQVAVHGVVTLVSPMIFIQDSTGGIAIPQAHTGTPVQIGDSVEARGDVEQHEFSSVLRNADVRLLWSHTPAPPVSVTASQAATGAFDAQYVETEGRLVSRQRGGGQSVVLKLDEGSQSFMAIAENPSLAATLNKLQYGSRLRLRGICVTDRSYAQNEMPFALLMRSVDDAEMIEPPPWWNTLHIIELIAGLLGVSFGLHMLFMSVKRSQLHAVIEERERLAMEMHDTLAQSFAGLGYQLEALSSEAPEGSPMRAQLESSVDLVRFGHMEARRNIAALRPGNLEQLGLEKSLEEAARTILQGGPVDLQMAVRGEPRPIPLRIADTLMRIGQEAIANAVQHGRPHTISLRLVYGRSSIKLTVRDDGQGFTTMGERSGFGIRGMKHRADGIAATLRIRSSLSHGTSVAVRAMLPQSILSLWWWQSIRTGRWRHWLHG
jgi:signal transduction histidine kinase